jgi:hypothetical protein
MSDQAAGDGTPQTPEALAADIEQTRQELSETIEALVAKTDVKARAQHRAAEVTESLRGKARDAKAKAAGRAAALPPAGSSVYAPALVAVTAVLIGVWLILRGRRR